MVFRWFQLGGLGWRLEELRVRGFKGFRGFIVGRGSRGSVLRVSDTTHGLHLVQVSTRKLANRSQGLSYSLLKQQLTL